MLTCQQMTELVTDYIEGRLSLSDRVGFQMHLGMCGMCRAYLRQMKTTVRVLGKLPDVPIPDGVRDELLARFRSVQPRSSEGKRRISISIRFLAWLERALGSKRGWVLAGLMLAGVLLWFVVSGIRPGPLGDGSRCLFIELLGGLGLLAAMGGLAYANHTRPSSATFTAVVMAGSLIGLGMVQSMCELSHSAQHVLTFHFGGMVLAGLAGMVASRLPAFR